MSIFDRTVMLIVFGIIFLVIFGVSAFIVDINHDFLEPYAAGVDSRFGQELDMFQNAILVLGVLLIVVAIVSYLIGASNDDSYQGGNI